MTVDRFGTGTDRYDAARPTYPDAFLRRLAEAVPAGPGLVLDVGAGTGILTRQLAAVFPERDLVGLEPSEAMRRTAETVGGAAYVAGRAEALPFGDRAAKAVVAGAAAHWFDRAAFYAEAHRVLRPAGVLAILDYPRDEERYPAVAAAEAFLRRFGARAYVRPDYVAELEGFPGFRLEAALEERLERRLPAKAFVDLVLSSSHARAAEAVLGEAKTGDVLETLAAGLVEADGLIAYGYRFRLTLVIRT